MVTTIINYISNISCSSRLSSLELNAGGCACVQVLTTWMPQDDEGGASWKSRRSTQVAASVLLLIDSHPLVLSNMVRARLILPMVGPPLGIPKGMSRIFWVQEML